MMDLDGLAEQRAHVTRLAIAIRDLDPGFVKQHQQDFLTFAIEVQKLYNAVEEMLSVASLAPDANDLNQ